MTRTSTTTTAIPETWMRLERVRADSEQPQEDEDDDDVESMMILPLD
jgi:hypothetical protein